MNIKQLNYAEPQIHGTYLKFAKSQHVSYSQMVVLVACVDNDLVSQKQICQEWYLSK
ncbi:UNVERIFIED_CONTAM: hypothetical protein KB582_10520 [Streptococcus canis]